MLASPFKIDAKRKEGSCAVNKLAIHLTLLLLCVTAPLRDAQAATPSKPNVPFIAVDDMNDWIGCMGATPRALTPNIDRLVSRGLLFKNAHTAGVFCAPSRSAIHA